MSKIVQKRRHRCGTDTKRYEKIDSRIYAKPQFQKDIYTTKKRDCTIAVPPIEALVLPFYPNSNTVAHAVYIIYG